jgi:hypothetical protein
MTVRGFVTADGRTVEHGQFGGLGQALVEGVLRDGTGARVALHVGDLFDVRLDELRAVHEATLPVAFER